MTPQQNIGHYRITAKLGEGGMGEVWRGTDTKLGREVALKILPASFAQDPERMARFEREAKVLASLNHPHIAQIYGIEERALVMELVEGETLKGPLPLDTALEYARQIADALEAAHEKGIVHRDLKPGNIMVTPSGTVKVLDFGLARVAEESPSDSKSPTMTISPTRAGVILGTARYMSPEQARGKTVDKRADIWAFGCVLYEMLTGKPAFTGETTTDILAAVVTKEPDLAKVPVKVRQLLRRCLEKDPKKRLRDIGDAWELLNDTDAFEATTFRERSSLAWIATAVLAVAAIILAGGLWRASRSVDRPLMRLDVDLGPDAVAGQFTTAAISPDGARLVFVATGSDGKQMLATRLLSEAKPVLLTGTENGSDPFFSPDGKWIGFFADGKMKKISVQGGAPIVLCDAPNDRGADWGEDDNIVVALNPVGALSRIPAEGGTPQPVTKGRFATPRWPQYLPGGDAVLFTLPPSFIAYDASVAAVSLKTGEIKILVRGGYFGRYLPTSGSMGHLVYVHAGTLFGVPFDPARLELRGGAVPILDDPAADPSSGAGQFSFSRTGSFVYRSGKASAQGWPVLWLDKAAKPQPLIARQGFWEEPRFSPDGQRLVLAQTNGDDRGIFVYDLQRDAMSRITSEAANVPVWSPDGKHIVFHLGSGLGWARADGAGETQRLLASKNSVFPRSFFPDGRRLAFHELDPNTGYDLWTLSLDLNDPDHPKAGKPEPFLRTPANERVPTVSPDGRWIAYQSDESGRYEVYVRPFPGPGGKWQISDAGGQLPVWSHKRGELFFETLDNRIMLTDYESKDESFVPGKPRLWSDQQILDEDTLPNYDLAPDGKRFAIFPNLSAAAGETGDVRITFLLNFFDELRRLAPVESK
jgi:Tol biopolymer transport system component/predicted Ser/Thr protein kinase